MYIVATIVNYKILSIFLVLTVNFIFLYVCIKKNTYTLDQDWLNYEFIIYELRSIQVLQNEY